MAIIQIIMAFIANYYKEFRTTSGHTAIFCDKPGEEYVEVRDKDCYILGTGGASLAVYKALKDLGGKVLFVSRNPKNPKTISYEELENRNIDVLVNATPVGMFPNVGVSPVKKSIAKRAKYVLDLIFNPKETQILKDANSKMNGLCMLVLQAVKSEEIWQNMEYTKDRKELLERIERGLE